MTETESRKAYRLEYYKNNKDRLRIMSRKLYYLKRYGLDQNIPKKRYYNTTRGVTIPLIITNKSITLNFD